MANNIDPRPVTSFDDLIAITEADREELRTYSTPSKWAGILALMPLLIGIAIVTVCVCVGYFLYLYQDAVYYGILAVVTLFFG